MSETRLWHCAKCKTDLPATSFPPSALRLTKKWFMCNPCRNAYYRGRRREDGGCYAGRYVKRRREKNSQWFLALKEKLSCSRCDETHVACLDFHHRDPASKEYNIGTMVYGQKKRSLIEAEIAKCDVLCSNCHRKEHYADGANTYKETTQKRHREYEERRKLPAPRGIHRQHLSPWRVNTLSRFMEVA